jgi:hypothetical protein
MTDLACPHGRKWTKCETCELIEAEIRVTAMQEEIVALRETLAKAVPTLDQFVSEVAHAQASGSSWYTRGAAGLYGHIAMWRGKAAVALAALREAGYLGVGE